MSEETRQTAERVVDRLLSEEGGSKDDGEAVKFAFSKKGSAPKGDMVAKSPGKVTNKGGEGSKGDQSEEGEHQVGESAPPKVGKAMKGLGSKDKGKNVAKAPGKVGYKKEDVEPLEGQPQPSRARQLLGLITGS